MTFELYSEWFKAAGEKELSDRLEQLKGVLKKLPRENYNNLRYLVQFLAHLSKQQAVNRMTPSNIAIVLGPNLLWPRTEGGGDSLFDMASASSVQVVTVIEPLIQFAESLFPEVEDFEVPELPASLDVKEAPIQSLIPKTEAPTTPSLSPPSTCPDGSNTFIRGTRRALVKSTSGANCTISWENPFESSIERPAPDRDSASNQGHNQQMEPCQSQSQNLSLPASTLDQLSSPTGISISFHEDRCVFQQHPPSSLSLDKQQGVSGFSKPTTLTYPPAQPAAPTPQPQPRKSQNRRPMGKKGIRPPNFPPPQPPPLVNRQVPSTTQ
ncbi:SH3 domain-binding protein 1-like isoform X1 [Arapaima gigas]